jgi:transposase
LTDHVWGVIAPLLPANQQRGAQWRDLPERYGPWQTCADRLSRWRSDGTWDWILAQAQTRSDAVGEVVWEVSMDSSAARAHQHACGARRQPSAVASGVDSPHVTRSAS